VNTLMLALVLGMIIGYTGVVGDRLGKAVDKAATMILMLMLVTMGIKLSAPKVVSNLGAIGFRSVVIAGASVAGSILAVGLVSMIGFRKKKTVPENIIQTPADEEAETT
jgi:uncharacterized membrane protein YadS